MNKDKISNVLFIGMFIVFLIVVSIALILNKNDYNLVDNRSSYKFQTFKIKDFISKKYQDNIENAANDQLPKYNYFEILYPKVSNYINYKSTTTFKLDKNNKYVNLGNIYLYNDYLLYNTIKNEELKNFDDDITKINYVINNTSKPIYIYYINNDNNIDFSNNKHINIEKYLKDRINIDDRNISSLKIDNFADYKKYFYKLDHHWNNIGTHKAYSDITEMMNLDSKLDVNDTICINNKNFWGSKANSIALANVFREKMCVYKYDFPEFRIKIDGAIVDDYGTNIEKLNSIETLSYANVYGSDYAEIIFENKDTDSNKNLLIYSNSYSNSINKLLASNYKNTYVIDGRYNSDFDMVSYIKEKNIDEVLILSNMMFFRDNITWGDF